MASLSVTIDKRHEDKLSDRAFLGTLGFFTTSGLALCAATAWMGVVNHVNIILALIVGFVVPFIGIAIASATRRWDVAWIGYLLVCMPFGLMLGPVLAQYHKADVIEAVAITGGVSGVMWLLGMLMPPIVKDLSGYIIGALLVLIVGNVARIFLPGFGVAHGFHWYAWVAAFLFSGLITYDVNKALQMPKDMYTAVVNALNIFLDIINLFLYILELTSSRSSSK